MKKDSSQLNGGSMSEVQIIQYGSADQWPQEVLVYTDGASRGNPGPASVGIHVCDFSENTIFEYGETLGEQTNNFAEYSAVKIALEMACEQKVEKIKIRSDSELPSGRRAYCRSSQAL